MVLTSVVQSVNRGTDLEDAEHYAGERALMGMLSNPEDVQAPLVDVLQILENRSEEVCYLEFRSRG